MVAHRYTPADVRLIRRAFAAVDSLLVAYEPPEETAPEPDQSGLLGVPVGNSAKTEEPGSKILGVPVASAGQTIPIQAPTFRQLQQSNQRVLEAALEKKFELKKLFRDQGIEYPAAETFLRILKRERELEVWVRPKAKNTFVMLKKYSICAMSGQLGPKRLEGDGQTPEGLLH